MSKVDFITFCHWRDWQRLFNYEELQKRVETHRYAFHEVIVVKQRLRDVPESKIAIFSNADRVVESEDYPHVLRDFGLPDEDKIADDYTHGPEAPHYWKWHVINHLIGLTVSQAEYIVFSDADCRMVSNAAPSWIDVGIQLLQQHPEILIVGPSDGGMMAERRIRKPYGVVRLTQNISQQVFLCNRQRLKGINFNVPWNWEKLAPGEPFAEYYYMLEGRLWRYMDKHGLYRALLPDQWRYWHDQW